MEIQKSYLGDGVYAIYDGYGIRLCANSDTNPTDSIYLESSVLDALENFKKRIILHNKLEAERIACGNQQNTSES